MINTLSKLHIRFIQSQESFLLNSTDNRHKLDHLYIKDSQHFYLLLDAPLSTESVTLKFTQGTDFLRNLNCEVSATLLDNNSETFKEAALFFPFKSSQIKHLALLTINAIS